MDQPTITTSHGKTDSESIIPVSQEATISCEVFSQPAATHFVWQKDQAILEHNSQHITLSSSSWEDTGNYVCEAHTDYVSKMSEMEPIKVYGQCVIKSVKLIPDLDLNGERTGGLKLEAVLDENVKPECTVDWDFNKNVYQMSEIKGASLYGVLKIWLHQNVLFFLRGFFNTLYFPLFDPNSSTDELPDINCRAKNSYHPEGVYYPVSHADLIEFVPPSNATLIICCAILLVILIATIIVAIYLWNKNRGQTNV